MYDEVSYYGYIFICAHEFEGVEEWNVVLFGDDWSDGCVVYAEVGISTGYDSFEVLCVVLVAKEGGYLFGDVWCFFSV